MPLLCGITDLEMVVRLTNRVYLPSKWISIISMQDGNFDPTLPLLSSNILGYNEWLIHFILSKHHSLPSPQTSQIQQVKIASCLSKSALPHPRHILNISEITPIVLSQLIDARVLPLTLLSKLINISADWLDVFIVFSIRTTRIHK